MMLRTEKIIFSHDTALFLNGLSERTPFEHSVTVLSNVVLSDVLREDCNSYYIKSELFELGMIWKKTTFGNEVRCYDAERTICDLLRSRNRMDEETVISAIKNYAKHSNIAAQVVLQNYMLECFLSRLSVSEYKDKFVIKGGMLIAAIVRLDTRSTMDLDTTLRNLPLTEEKIKEIDWFCFM